MAQSLARVLIHIIFGTRHRETLIDESLQARLWPYVGGIVRDLDCPPLQVGGAADHLHVLLGLSRTISIADLVKQMKTATTQWIKKEGVPEFAWQSGYGAFSVSESKAATVVEYILSQSDHHRERSFQEEYREFLVRHRVQFDERYVWD